MSTSRASHTSQQALLTAVADAYPDLHGKHLEAGCQAAAKRDAKERKMPNDITFHNASTHWKGHKEHGPADGSKVRGVLQDALSPSHTQRLQLTGDERTSDQVKVVDDDHLGKQGRR